MHEDTHGEIATSLSEDLIFRNLLIAKNKEKSNSKLSACFICALEKLQREPPCVRRNAHVTISDGHTLKEFTSGNEECAITIFYNQGKVQYDVFVPTWELYLSRLCSSTQPLSLGTLLSIRNHLQSWGSTRNGLSSLACFDRAVERFSMEPDVVRQDAEMLVECGGNVMRFISGKESCKISVFSKHGEPEYDIEVHDPYVAMERLRTGIEPLTVENLLRIKDRLGTLKWWEFKGYLDEAISKFCLEPLCVQKNARMLIMKGSERILLISGKGENLITVSERFGMIKYQVSVRGWWEQAARTLKKFCEKEG